MILLAAGWLMQYTLPAAVSLFHVHHQQQHKTGTYCNCDDECNCSCALPLQHHSEDAHKHTESSPIICGCDHGTPTAFTFPSPVMDKAWLLHSPFERLDAAGTLEPLETTYPQNPPADRLLRPPRLLI